MRKHFYLPDELVSQLVSHSKKNKKNASTIVTEALEYYFKHEARDYPEIAKIFDALLKGNLTNIAEETMRTRVTLNQVLKENQLHTELWNSYYHSHGEGTLMSTDVKQANELLQAEAIVKSRIANAQQNSRW